MNEYDTRDIKGEETNGKPRAAAKAISYATPDNKPYVSPTPGQITIVATTPNAGTSAPSDALCAELYSCGFNSALMTVTYSEISDSLRRCGNAGIRPFIHHSYLMSSKEACEAFVSTFMKDGNLGGWDLEGQPTYGELATGGTLQKYYNTISNKDTQGHPIFVSLVGGPVSSYMTDGTVVATYEQYVSRFQTTLNPMFWPYVLYPIVRENGEIAVRYDIFFTDLEIFSLVSRYTHRPFWAYVRSQGVMAGSLDYPNPTEPHLRFAAFSALAYGAQGLVYWTYRQREDEGTNVYALAPVDKNGVKTPIWGYVQNVNREIRALNSVFAGCECVECRHTGSAVYRSSYSYGIDGAIGPLIKISSPDPGVLVAHLNNAGKDYLLIVSHDVKNQITISLEFSDFWTVSQLKVVRLTSGNDISYVVLTSHVNGGQVNATIAAGGYLLYEWS